MGAAVLVYRVPTSLRKWQVIDYTLLIHVLFVSVFSFFDIYFPFLPFHVVVLFPPYFLSLVPWFLLGLGS